MAVIDRPTLLADVKKYLGDANVLDDATILELGEDVILKVGDDDTHYKEIRCKTLKATMELNKHFSITDGSRGIKKEVSYEREVEYFNGSDFSKYWQERLNDLPDLCALLGYCGLKSRYYGMFKANVATPVRVPAGNSEYGTVERKADYNGKPFIDEYDD